MMARHTLINHHKRCGCQPHHIGKLGLVGGTIRRKRARAAHQILLQRHRLCTDAPRRICVWRHARMQRVAKLAPARTVRGQTTHGGTIILGRTYCARAGHRIQGLIKRKRLLVCTRRRRFHCNRWSLPLPPRENPAHSANYPPPNNVAASKRSRI